MTHQSRLVSLHSNHTHEHVLAKLNTCADHEYIGSDYIMFDTTIEDIPAGSYPYRPWDVGNNHRKAVHEWLKNHPELEIDKAIVNKLLINVAQEVYLKRASISSNAFSVTST